MEASSNDAMTEGLKAELLEAINQLPSQTENSVDESRDLKNIIQKWISTARDIPRQTGEFIYLLEESQSAGLSANALGEADSVRFNCLRSLESRCRFNVFIVQVEKREIGTGIDPSYPHGTYECMECEEDPDHEVLDEGDSIADTNWTLKAVLFDKKESRKPLTLNANPDSILQGDIFEDTLPHEEGGLPDDYDEPFEPDSYGFTRYYRLLALLIVPQATTVTYLTDCSTTRDDNVAADLLEYFSSKCTQTKGDSGVSNTLVRLCELFLLPKDVESDTRMDIPEPVIIKILETAMACHSQPLFDLVWDNNSANLSPQFFLQMLAKIGESSMLTLDMLILALDRSVFSQKTLGERFKFIRGLNGITDKPPKELEVHILDLFDKMINLCYQSKLFERDGEVFVWIACCYRDYEWLLKTIDPLIHKQCENIAFILGFCWELYDSGTHNRLQVSDSFNWIKTTIRSLIVRLDVRNHLLSMNGFQCWEQDRETQCRCGNPNEMPIPPPPPPVTSQSLLNLCKLLLDLDMKEDLRDLARKLTNQSGRISPFEFVPLLVPFVGNLMNILENRPVSLGDPALSALIRTIIVAFWNGYVIPGEPVWEEPCYEALDSCACGFCVSVKLNLQKPKIKSWSIKEKEDKAKRHIAKVLKDLAWESYYSYHRHNAKTFSTWYITKLPTKYEEEKSIWEKRVADARTQLAEFNQQKLLRVLGPSYYYYITGNNLPRFKNPQHTKSAQLLVHDTSNNAVNHGHGAITTRATFGLRTEQTTRANNSTG
ncbi:hypothetical protein F4806DRAFT_463153 [Annulohypoxylon nitens]|nr:hypothetical protein F4806DRAFT_463153 [Annulohypoxylon nitens]